MEGGRDGRDVVRVWPAGVRVRSGRRVRAKQGTWREGPRQRETETGGVREGRAAAAVWVGVTDEEGGRIGDIHKDGGRFI